MTFDLPNKPVLMENIKITNNSTSTWFGFYIYMVWLKITFNSTFTKG